MTERRVKIIFLSDEIAMLALRGLFAGHAGIPILPADFVCERIHWDWRRAEVTLTISHPSFDLVESGNVPPALKAELVDGKVLFNSFFF
jgi:hypothetical protein